MNKMLSGDFILRHAVNNIWSLPDQDKQLYIKPARLSGDTGDYLRFSYLLNTIALPEPSASYMVYQVGQIHPKLLNLSEKSFKKWINLNEICEGENILIDVFTESGITVPRSICFYRVSPDRNLIIAIRMPNAVSNFDIINDSVCLRIYANSHYRISSRNINDPKALIFGGGIISSTHSAGDMQREIYAAVMPYKSGSLICNVNGFYIETISPASAKAGDYADWYFDSTIFRQVDYDVEALLTYKSTVDNEDKYILNHNVDVTTIEHIDDIDFYLIVKSNQRTYGVQIQQYNKGSVVMLTHRDYGIAVKEITSRLTELGTIPDGGKLFIRAMFRKTRGTRPLIDESSRIRQLYKLDYAKRRDVMSGASGPSVWHAASLEKCGYVSLMTADYNKVDRLTVQDAYGYHALSKILGNTPSKPREASGQLVVDVPIGLQQSCTGYEYSATGKLLHVAFNGSDTVYRCTKKETALVELVFGEGGQNIDLLTGTNTGTYDSRFNYRFYHKTDDVWKDVSATGVTINTNIWSMSGQPSDCVALSNKKHLLVKLQVQPRDGVMVFKLVHKVNNRLVPIPFHFGEYDIYLNDNPIIEGIDFVIDFPNVYLISKDHFNDTGVQNITIRGMNFCNADMTHREPEEIGFVKGGVLSRDAKNELRDDRVLSIYCGGSFYDRSTLVMDEDSPNVIIRDGKEGMPYSINHLIVPMSNFLVHNTAPIDTTEIIRNKALLLDKEIIAYLDSLDVKSATIPTSLEYHQQTLYSPFFSRVINDLENQYFWDNRFKDGGYIDDGEIDGMLDYYLPLLVKDPVKITNADYVKYTVIEPVLEKRVFKLGINQKNLLDLIVSKYGNDRINLDGWIEVKI